MSGISVYYDADGDTVEEGRQGRNTVYYDT